MSRDSPEATASSLLKQSLFDESVLLSAFFLQRLDYIEERSFVFFFSSSTEFELRLVSVYNQ